MRPNGRFCLLSPILDAWIYDGECRQGTGDNVSVITSLRKCRQIDAFHPHLEFGSKMTPTAVNLGTLPYSKWDKLH